MDVVPQLDDRESILLLQIRAADRAFVEVCVGSVEQGLEKEVCFGSPHVDGLCTMSRDLSLHGTNGSAEEARQELTRRET